MLAGVLCLFSFVPRFREYLLTRPIAAAFSVADVNFTQLQHV
jgi:hypothetical protein